MEKIVRLTLFGVELWKNIVYDELFEKCPNKNVNQVTIKRSADRMHY